MWECIHASISRSCNLCPESDGARSSTDSALREEEPWEGRHAEKYLEQKPGSHGSARAAGDKV
jgi:hypothetical protein